MNEQKIWINKMPDSCFECPCFQNNIECPCGLSDGSQDFFRDEIDGANCPLIEIKDHDKKILKQTYEKIDEEKRQILNRLDAFDKWHDEIEIKGDLYIYLIDAKQLVEDLRNIINGKTR